MDEWASGKYSGRVAFVCVSLAGPELASTFVKELKLSESTVIAYTDENPAWGQLGCGGFIVYDGDGRIASRKTAAYLEVRGRAFKDVESLLDSLLEGANPGEGAPPLPLPPPPPPPPLPETPRDADRGVCGAASGCAPQNPSRLEEWPTGTCAASPFRPPGGRDGAVASVTAPVIPSVGISALDQEHAACTAALQELASTRSVAALERVLSAYEAHFSHEEALLDTHLWYADLC